MISENIARLRREAGMTQEKLASAVGISTQAVSKWENGTTMPDVTLLPLIADQFGVSVDELYGRKREQDGRIDPSALPQEAYRAVIGCLGRAFHFDDRTPEEAADAIQSDLKKDPKCQSMFCRANYGTVYAACDMAFVRTKTEKESAALLDDGGAVGYLGMLCDPDIRKVLTYILSGPDAVTARSAAGKCGISEEKADEALGRLTECGNLARMQVDTGDDEPLTLYMSNARERSALIFMIFELASRLAGYQRSYYGFIG